MSGTQAPALINCLNHAAALGGGCVCIPTLPFPENLNFPWLLSTPAHLPNMLSLVNALAVLSHVSKTHEASEATPNSSDGQLDTT